MLPAQDEVLRYLKSGGGEAEVLQLVGFSKIAMHRCGCCRLHASMRYQGSHRSRPLSFLTAAEFCRSISEGGSREVSRRCREVCPSSSLEQVSFLRPSATPNGAARRTGIAQIPKRMGKRGREGGRERDRERERENKKTKTFPHMLAICAHKQGGHRGFHLLQKSSTKNMGAA